MSALGRITRGSHIKYYSLEFFIAYTFKGQVHVLIYRTCENCKPLVLQDKCNIEIFLSPDSHFHPSIMRKFCTRIMFADIMFKEKSQSLSQTKNSRKGVFLNINCLQFIENIIFRRVLTIYGVLKNSLTFFIFSEFLWLKVKFPDYFLTWIFFIFHSFFPDLGRASVRQAYAVYYVQKLATYAEITHQRRTADFWKFLSTTEKGDWDVLPAEKKRPHLPDYVIYVPPSYWKLISFGYCPR